jgi:hypothetical protein
MMSKIHLVHHWWAAPAFIVLIGVWFWLNAWRRVSWDSCVYMAMSLLMLLIAAGMCIAHWLP